MHVRVNGGQKLGTPVNVLLAIGDIPQPRMKVPPGVRRWKLWTESDIPDCNCWPCRALVQRPTKLEGIIHTQQKKKKVINIDENIFLCSFSVLIYEVCKPTHRSGKVCARLIALSIVLTEERLNITGGAHKHELTTCWINGNAEVRPM